MNNCNLFSNGLSVLVTVAQRNTVSYMQGRCGNTDNLACKPVLFEPHTTVVYVDHSYLPLVNWLREDYLSIYLFLYFWPIYGLSNYLYTIST
jgi:hypothetical protein